MNLKNPANHGKKIKNYRQKKWVKKSEADGSKHHSNHKHTTVDLLFALAYPQESH